MNELYVCPAMSTGIEQVHCITEECAWYNSEMQVCAVLAGTSQLQQIVEKVTELQS